MLKSTPVLQNRLASLDILPERGYVSAVGTGKIYRRLLRCNDHIAQLPHPLPDFTFHV